MEYSKFKVVSSLVLFAVSLSVGANEMKTEYGGFVAATYNSSGFSDIPTDTVFSVSKIGGAYNAYFDRDSAIMSEVFYYSDEFNGSETNYGMEVKGYGFSSTYTKRFKFGRAFKPWLGIGFSYNSYDFKNIFTRDSDGFALDIKPDESDSYFGFIINATIFYKLKKENKILFKLAYENSLGNGIDGISINLGFLFK